MAGKPKPFDLGRMERPGGVQYFAVACGAGYDARVMAGTLSEHKRRWGMAAYVATTLRLITDIRSTTHLITIDGVEYDAEAAMVLVANCGEVIPPLVRLRAGIRPDDGLLDVVVMRANSFGQSVRAVWDLLRDAPTAEGQETFVGLRPGPGDPGGDRSGPAGPARRRAGGRDAFHRQRRPRRDQDHGSLRHGAKPRLFNFWRGIPRALSS